MEPKLIGNKVYVPLMPSELADGTMVDAMVELKPGDEHYQQTLAWCRLQDAIDTSASTDKRSDIQSW